MRISAGKVIDKGKATEEINAKEYILNLMNASFNGYITVTAEGNYGLEEGIIVFSEGKIVASSYNYFTFEKEFRAEEALKRSLNAFLNPRAIIDSYALESYQVQLFMTLNDDYLLKEGVGPENLTVPNSFSRDFENEVLHSSKEASGLSREALLKKYNLVMLSSPPSLSKGDKNESS